MSVEQIQALVDELAGRLGRAVLVDDRDLRLVAASRDFGDADPARVWSLLHRRTRPEDVRLTEITRLDGPGYVPENPALELWQRLCVPVRCQGLLLGFVWVTDRYGEMSPEQVADVTGTTGRIGVLLRERLVAGERDQALHRELVEALLSRDAATRDEAWDEAVDRGLLDDGGHLAVLFVRRGASGDATPGKAFLPDVERLARDHPGLRALAATWPRRAIAVVAGRPGEDLDGPARALAHEIGKAGPWRVAVGGPVPGPAGLPAARRQADIALSTLRAAGVACWAELSADALLAQFPRQLWTDALLPAGIARLLADPSASVLLPTLSAFLDCAGEAQRTAAQLQVHRTTLYYRLSRIEQISGLSLRDGRDRLLAHLALRLHHLHGAPAVATDVEDAGRNLRRDAG
jgi:PucR C-terminal helix-turn-helix domain/GGDEF-like domain